ASSLLSSWATHVWRSRPRPHAGLRIRAPLQIGAALYELVEGFGIVQKDPVVGHLLVVRIECPHCLPVGDELQGAGYRGGVVDPIAFPIPFAEELVLEFGNILRKCAIIESFFRIARIIQPHEIMPMAGKAVAERTLLAKGVNRGGLFPERPLGKHHPWRRGR